MTFNFDFNESFKRLATPPIVEAVIHWRARAQTSFNPDSLRDRLLARLTEFETCEPFQHFEFAAEFYDDEGKPNLKHREKSDFHGFRLTTRDGRHVAQFNRDGVIFSCTQGYDHWENFTVAARRVWRAFLDFAKPVETERLGVRFINQFKTATLENVGEFLRDPPSRPPNLPLKEFVYQSTLTVPGYPFEIRLIKVMQPPMPEMPRGAGLFVDLDVYMTTPLPNDEVALDQTFKQIRYLKNKVFFTLIKPEAMQPFMEIST